MFANWCRDMWSILIAYKYIERTAAGTIHRQRRQPGTEVTSTHDADGARRMFWDQVGVQWSWQSLLRLLEPSSVVILPLAVRQELSWVNSRLGESARRCVRCTGWFQPVNRCRLLSALTPGFISAFSCSSLTGLFAPSFRGTVKAALTGVSLHYLLTGSMSVPSFRLPVPIWLAVEALIVPCVLIGCLQLTSLPNSKNTPCQCQMLGARFFLLLAASFLPLILVKLKFTVPRGEQICTSWKMLFLLAVLIGSRSRVPFFANCLSSTPSSWQLLSCPSAWLGSTSVEKLTYLLLFLSTLCAALTSGTYVQLECLTSCTGYFGLGFVLRQYIVLDHLSGRVSSCWFGERAGWGHVYQIDCTSLCSVGRDRNR